MQKQFFLFLAGERNFRRRLRIGRSGRGTALFKTVMHSIQEFKGCTGYKHLLLFTDGKDTDGGPDAGTLVAMLVANYLVRSINHDKKDTSAADRLSGRHRRRYSALSRNNTWSIERDIGGNVRSGR